MAFLLPRFSPSLIVQSNHGSREKPISCVPRKGTLYPSSDPYPYFRHTKLENPPVRDVQDKDRRGPAHNSNKNDFYVNLGSAVRTLREDLPSLFNKELNYDIYRDDITFTDPLNELHGIENYKLIFWALRFHGRIMFREISVEIFRVWQPSENVILIRWNLRGVPRVPWEAKGQFQGTSRYKLDRNGKIYEHKVDNLAFNFPWTVRSTASVLDLVSACPASPNPTFMWGLASEIYSSPWVEFYRAVRATLDCEDYLIGQEGLVTCS